MSVPWGTVNTAVAPADPSVRGLPRQTRAHTGEDVSDSAPPPNPCAGRIVVSEVRAWAYLAGKRLVMPSTTRALTRAARDRAKATGIPYTEAREQLLWIQQLVDEGEFETREEADVYVSDPANQVMCRICGWTYGMVCPECSKGCGCSVGCTGWRHGEFDAGADDDPEVYRVECEECGGSYDRRNGPTGYDCTC